MIAHERLAHLDQVCPVRQSVISDGPARGCRAIDVTPLGGLAVGILPDCGLDVLDARNAGVPLHWVRPAGEAPPLPVREGHRWLEAFAGGLVTTCGLADVGEPVGGHGLHGDASHPIASEVTVAGRHGGRVLFGDPTALPGGSERPGRLVEGLMPVTVEHQIAGHREGRAWIRRPSLGLEVEIRFGLDTLPRLFQWVDTRPGQAVVALKPANATAEAVETDWALAALPPLGAGTARVPRLSIGARSMETPS
jgi:hypothetical protein